MQRFVRAILRKWSVHLQRGRLQPKKVRHKSFGVNFSFQPIRRVHLVLALMRSVPILGLLFFSSSQQFRGRRSRDDTIELGSVVIHDADVFDHQIIDFPFFVDAMESVVDSERVLFIADDPSVHPRRVSSSFSRA